MTTEIKKEAEKLEADIVCGASYQLFVKSWNSNCTLYFTGTAGKQDLMCRTQDIPLIDNDVIDILLFIFILFIAIGEGLSAIETIQKWTCPKQGHEEGQGKNENEERKQSDSSDSS